MASFCKMGGNLIIYLGMANPVNCLPLRHPLARSASKLDGLVGELPMPSRLGQMPPLAGFLTLVLAPSTLRGLRLYT